MRFACVTWTPLGTEVDPEVYWSNAGMPGSRLTGSHLRGPSGETPSVETTVSSWNAFSLTKRCRALVLTSDTVSATDGFASRMMAFRRSAPRFGRGGYAGTAMRPL